MGSTARYHQFFKFVNITTGKEYLLDDITGSLTEATNKIENLEQRLQNISSAYIYKGTVADFDSLPTTADIGNVYNVEDDGMNYAWTGTEWDALGPTIDLTPYATVSELTEHESASATTSSLGHVKLSLSDTVSDSSAPIGTLSNGKIAVPAATMSTYGAVKKSSEHGTTLPVIGMNSSGQLSLNVRTSHSGFEQTENRELYINTGSDDHPAVGTTGVVVTNTAGKLAITNATSSSFGGVKIASSMNDTATHNVPNASLVKSYVGNITSPILTSINDTQTSLTSYITENNNRVDSIEGNITTKYNELTGLIDTTETAFTTSLTSYQTSTDNTIQALNQTVVDNKTSTDTSIQALTSEVNTLTQTVETNKNSTDSSIQTLSSSVYTKDEVDEKFRTNKGYIILRDYETI